MKNIIGIIGGSGFNQLKEHTKIKERKIATPYGETSSALKLYSNGGQEVWFLARHGEKHHIAPHKINYKANVWALKEAGVSTLVALASVGGIQRDYSPSSLPVP